MQTQNHRTEIHIVVLCTLEVFGAHEAGIDVDVRQRHRTKLLKIKVQQRPANRT